VAAFSAAAQHKPYLLQDHLPSLLPLLLKETEVRPELIRKIPMGPFTSESRTLKRTACTSFSCGFKTSSRNGRRARKQKGRVRSHVYSGEPETASILLCNSKLIDASHFWQLSTCLSRVDVNEFLDRVISGLKDLDDVKVLCYMSLHRLAQVAPTSVLARLDDCAEGITVTMQDITVTKKDSMAQDIQRNVRMGAEESAISIVRSHAFFFALAGGDAAFRYSRHRPTLPPHERDSKPKILRCCQTTGKQ
jgi:cullin-associated NEDD8-dissociated protein 1